jgi:predicted outer membrane repeat protein
MYLRIQCIEPRLCGIENNNKKEETMLRKTTLTVLIISLVILSSTSQPGAISAGINVWTRNGPEGESIRAPAIGPATLTTPYAGMRGGGVFAIQPTDVVSRTWHIATDGSDITGDGSEAKPFATIQHGIGAAANGDTVLVHPGVYKENINFNGKNITVGSLFVTTGNEDYILLTVIDGNRSGRVVTFVNGEAATAKLSGFTLTRGYASGASQPDSSGGGIYCLHASPTLSHLKVADNEAVEHGGGLWAVHCSTAIRDVMFIENRAGGGGGAISYAYGSMSLENAVIAYNWGRGDGGGLSLYHPEATIKNALIADNSGGGKGGGIHFDGSSPTFINVTIVGNRVTGEGQGGGMDVSYMSQPALVNSIVWGNTPEQIYFDTDWWGQAITIEYSDVQGGAAGIVTNGHGPVYWGNGNMDISPRFVSVGLGNYHLADDSPCINAGKAAGAPVTDIEGNPRPNPAGSNPDLGAYENPSSAGYSIYLPLVLGRLESQEESR